jgi:hypothetical protein
MPGRYWLRLVGCCVWLRGALKGCSGVWCVWIPGGHFTGLAVESGTVSGLVWARVVACSDGSTFPGCLFTSCQSGLMTSLAMPVCMMQRLQSGHEIRCGLPRARCLYGSGRGVSCWGTGRAALLGDWQSGSWPLSAGLLFETSVLHSAVCDWYCAGIAVCVDGVCMDGVCGCVGVLQWCCLR